jgi:predicted AAA+ superfamily ATPase
VLADRKPLPARFLILGSASPSLLRQSSESLASRIEIIPVGGFSAGHGLLQLGGGEVATALARISVVSRSR